MKPTPMQSIVGGLAAMALFGWIMLSLWVLDPPGRLASADVKVVAGRVVKTGHVGVKAGYDTLEIWIEGQPIPFRSFDGPYPKSFDAEVLSMLRPGVDARVSVEPEDLASPRRNLAQNQLFYPLVALDVAGRPALTLEAYNAWSVKNQKTGFVVLPVLFLCGVGLLRSGLLARRLQSYGNLSIR